MNDRPDPFFSSSCRIHLSSRTGFTLIELLIVLVIIGLVAGLALPEISTLTSQGAEERALRIIAGATARAQDRALARRAPQTITIDLEAHIVTVSGEAPTPLPEGAEIGIRPADAAEPFKSGAVSLAVDRHGNVEPFELRIGRSIIVAANPFTGALEAPLAP